jgi:alpha-ketoglutaric semialdehyde dehydrogenase
MRGLVVDDALKPGTHIGPVVDATQLEQDLPYVAIGQSDGAKLAVGGERPKRATLGFYMVPALFLDVDNSMRISRVEIFRPVSARIPAHDYDHALAIANDAELGLCAGIAQRA